MTLYNLFLNTKMGSRMASDPSNEGFMSTLRFICEVLEAVGVFFFIGGAVGWSYGISSSGFSMIVVFSILTAYLMLRFTVGNAKYSDYLIRRARLGLGPDEKPLDKELNEKHSWFDTSKTTTGSELSVVRTSSSADTEDDAFEISEEVMEQWKKELGK